MKSSLSTYVTVYKDVADIVYNGKHYRKISEFFPTTVSFNVSGHETPLDLATDILRIWDVLLGQDTLVHRYIRGELFLHYLRKIADSKLVDHMVLRIVGLSAHPDAEIKTWDDLESIISHLLTLKHDQVPSMTYPVTMAEHFANITGHASTSHLWIFGQGDYAAPEAMNIVAQLFKQKIVPDIISLPVQHSIPFSRDEDEIFDAIQMRQLESISGSLYSKNYLRHMPREGKRWWPHIESVMHEARASDRRPIHLVLGKGSANPPECFVYVAPNPNWNKTQELLDEVYIERYQVCLQNLGHVCDRYVWWFSFDDLDYAEGLCARARMTSSDLALFWATICNTTDSRILLRPYSAVIIPFQGDIGQQVLSAATYFMLKMTGHWVFADMSGMSMSYNSLEADDTVWELEPFGLGMHIFEPPPDPLPRMLYIFKKGSPQIMQLGIDALSNPSIQNIFDTATVKIGPDMRLDGFMEGPYVCIHIPDTFVPGIGNETPLTTLLSRLSGIVENVIVLTEVQLTDDTKIQIGKEFKNKIFLNAGHDHYLNHRLMKNARFLICSNSRFDVVASALNNNALAFVPKNWRINSNPIESQLLDAVSTFYVLGRHIPPD